MIEQEISMLRITQLKAPIEYDEELLTKKAAKALGVPAEKIQKLVIRRRSLDARKKPDIFYTFTVDVQLANEKTILKKCRNKSVSLAENVKYQYPMPGHQELITRPVVIGSGPAGLFCGLLLARCGYRPLLLERGESVEERTKSVEDFWNGKNALDPQSNVQFGEGGAGTFSDGKLNTMVKDRQGRNGFVLQTFAEHGADPQILYMHKPHIGTDVLKTVVKNIRQEIESLGGEIRFSSCVTDLFYKDQKITGIEINHEERIDCEVVIAAIGHSARDTFEMLSQKELRISPKSFAVGLRVEHPQEMINISQYGRNYPKALPAADYKLTAQVNGRGVYSFCMCPGGYVVNASSEEGRIAVNGMSYHAREGQNANSALVVTVTPEDYGGTDVLAGVRFQRKLEEAACREGKGNVPVQLLDDFVNNRTSKTLGTVTPNLKGSYTLSNLRNVLPEFISQALIGSIPEFDHKIHGYAMGDAVFSGVESRTSSPVRIWRNEDFCSDIEGFYPCGEGAGYAGGITSAAMDGMKCAEAVIAKYQRLKEFF